MGVVTDDKKLVTTTKETKIYLYRFTYKNQSKSRA